MNWSRHHVGRAARLENSVVDVSRLINREAYGQSGAATRRDIGGNHFVRSELRGFKTGPRARPTHVPGPAAWRPGGGSSPVCAAWGDSESVPKYSKQIENIPNFEFLVNF